MVKRKHDNRMPIVAFISDDNIHVCDLSYCLLDISSQHNYDLDLNLSNGPRSNANMLIKSNIGLLFRSNSSVALFVNIYEIFTVKICMTLSLTFRMDQGEMKIYQLKASRRGIGNGNVCSICPRLRDNHV